MKFVPICHGVCANLLCDMGHMSCDMGHVTYVTNIKYCLKNYAQSGFLEYQLEKRIKPFIYGFLSYRGSLH